MPAEANSFLQELLLLQKGRKYENDRVAYSKSIRHINIYYIETLFRFACMYRLGLFVFASRVDRYHVIFEFCCYIVGERAVTNIARTCDPTQFAYVY